MLLYPLIDLHLAAMTPLCHAAQAFGAILRNPFLPFFWYEPTRAFAVQISLLEHAPRLIPKPSFDIKTTKFRGEPVMVRERLVGAAPFCNLLHFERRATSPAIQTHIASDPKVLIVTPMSGHYATLMRGTVEAMLPSHDVYITDWSDAKMVPLEQGYFDLEDQIEYLASMIGMIGESVNIIAISQASVSALSAVALLAAREPSFCPPTLTLIGGPIDARTYAVGITEMAAENSLSTLRAAQIQMIPPYYPGAGRRVYPGLTQLMDRMSLSLGRHITEQIKYFHHLVRGDDDAAAAHERFYEEFLAVTDVPEEFYLQYVERAYQRHDLANGSFVFRGQKVELDAIRQTALLTVEGELDDLSPAGHTRAAIDLCTNIPADKKKAHLEIGVGHYGVFNGRKWRNNIQPLIHKFIREHAPAE